MSRGLKSPSKFLSLQYLLMIQEHDYCNRDTGIDYVPTEVDNLIFDKLSRKDQHDIMIQEREFYAFYLYDLKKRGCKPCTNCKNELPFDQFHKASCKKTFGLRSHCKFCRKEKIPF